ncbi:MAG TPA: DUF72 domain-containing protein [Pyrinomonadaceae bacterium]|nr:DUF72 domain-containing protein [Pyrinomonadaceae bacterium]
MVKDDSQSCVQVGCQGWNYDDWITGAAASAPVFYPKGTRSADMLSVYARVFDTVEVDSTFYAVPSAQTLDSWNKRTPRSFTFSLKLPQVITHEWALRPGSLEELSLYCDRAQLLGEKLAVTLIQLPPHFTLTPENALALRDFIERLPGDMRFAVEFRSPDWLHEKVIKLLSKHNVAIALVEGRWIKREEMRRIAEEPAADFAYVRWMGERDLTRFDEVQRAQDENLREWAEVIGNLCGRVSHVYAYFSNFYEGHAPASANKLKRLLSQETTDPATLEGQPSLF